MAEDYKLPTALETMPADYWWPKFVMSGVCLFVGFNSYNHEHSLSIFVSILFFTLGLAMLSLTRIKPEPESLKYRRFFQWKKLAYSEIEQCAAFWVLGFVRPKHWIFPSGSIWFHLPRDRKYDWRWDHGIISFIRRKAGLSQLSD